MKTKILITDDHLVVRKGLVQIISETFDMEVTGEAGSGHEALQMVQKGGYDVVLLDISMPGRGGLEVLKEIKSIDPGIPVLMLSVHPEEQYAIRALKGGAAGYITKDTAAEELLNAIRRISRGRKFVSAELAEKLATELAGDAETLPHERLSDREYQVFLLISSGRTVGEIAVELNLSVKTISTYRTRILEKIGMRNNAELTHYAVTNGLVN